MTSQDDAPCTSRTTSEYESALRIYDQIVLQYVNDVAHLTEADIVTFEARLTRALCQVLVHRPDSSTSISRPMLSEWLRVIGLSPTNIRHLELCGVHDILALVQKKEKETKSLAERGRYSPESKRRILRSCDATCKYLEALKGRREPKSFTDKQLSWSVYSPLGSKKSATWRAASTDSASPPSPRFVVTSVDALSERESGRGSSCSDRGVASGSGGSFPGTPSMPSASSHSRSVSGSGGSLTVLSGRATLSPSSPLSSSAHSTPALGASSRVLQSSSMQFGNPPKSPKTSRLVHAIPHKWHRSTKYWPSSNDNVCHFCQRPLGFGFLNAWEKCRSCKWKVHSHCKSRIGDSCGLTPDHIRRVFDQLIQQNNGDMWNDPQSAVPMSRSLNEPAFQYPDNAAAILDSSSSTNSSAPSTPALPLSLGSVNSPYNLTAPSRSCDRKFTFPDSVPEVPDIVLPETSEAGSSMIDYDMHEHSNRIGEGSEGTLVVDSTGTVTDLAASEGSAGSGGGGRSPGGHTWDRHKWSMSTIRGPNAQASWNELTIPIGKIDFKRNAMLGRGRFGYVRRGYHFGDVAVKFLNMDHIEEGRKLDEFKAEVAAHKNTRHDNIVLFLGYCMEQDRLAIVMSLCKGQPLHRMLHEAKERIDLSVALQLATQICQGVSYLHTKKILHKDLRSKNIFIESKNKVVITDFGLFSMKRLKTPHRNNTIIVPQHWLSYLAPELVRSISDQWTDLPFSESFDVYAFSTIWYELLTYSFPFARESPDRIVWMVGSGMKTPLHNIKAIREVKELLLRCWSFSADDRPSFPEILALLNALPRKRLDRSPSFPAIRSFESLF